MRRALLAVPCLLAFDLARAQETPPDLGTIVVTATRVPTPVDEIAAGVTVIDRDTILARDYVTLAQALEAVPGLHIVQSGGPGGNASVFIRGTNSDQVLLLRDGMPVNDSSDASGAFNFGTDTNADIERIEVVRGPLASLYGSAAIGGVINIISRRGEGDGPTVSGSLAGGYPRQILGDVSLTGVSGIVDYAVIFESQSQQGFDVTPRRESIYSGVPDGFTAQVGTVNVGVTPVEGVRLYAFGRARQSSFGFDTLGIAGPTFDDANSTGYDAQMIGRIGADATLLGGALDSHAFLGRIQDDRRYFERLNPADPNQAAGDSRYHGYRTDAQINNAVHLDRWLGEPGITGADITFGYEHQADAATVRENSTSVFGPFTQNAKVHQDSDAGYVGGQVTVARRLTMTAQAREDSTLNDTPFTWRVGGVVAVPEVSARIKASLGTGFRAPSLFDRYGVDSFGYVGNPNLRPEKATGYEAGAELDLPEGLGTLGATYFHTQVHDLIANVFSPVDTEINIGAAHLQGAETVLDARPLSWLTVEASWTYTQAENAETGERLPRRPQNTATLNAEARPLPGLTIAPELTYTGRFQDFLIDDAGNSANVGSSKPGTIVNLAVTYEVREHVAVFAKGFNLFDSRFEPASGYVTPGASFIAGVRLTELGR